jgi:hypothetical protein
LVSRARVSLLAETRFTIYFCKPVDQRIRTFAHVPRAGCEWNLTRYSAQPPGKSLGEGSFGGSGPVESSVRSNGSFERCLAALKPPDPKFRVSIYPSGGDRVGRWFPLTEPA